MTRRPFDSSPALFHLAVDEKASPTDLKIIIHLFEVFSPEMFSVKVVIYNIPGRSCSALPFFSKNM